MSIKRIIQPMVILFIFLSLSLTLAGCGDGDVPPEKKIKTAFLDALSDGREVDTDAVTLRSYYTFRNGQIYYLDGLDYETGEVRDEVWGLTFRYPTEQKMYAYVYGKVYTLYDLYKNALISADELTELYKKHKSDNSALYDAVGVPENALKHEIQSAYYENYIEGTALEDYINKADLSVRIISSTMGFEANPDAFAVFIDGIKAYGKYEGAEYVKTLSFRYSTEQRAFIYKNGDFYGIEEAYQLGIISYVNAAELYQRFLAIEPDIYKREADLYLSKITRPSNEETAEMRSVISAGEDSLVVAIDEDKLYGVFDGLIVGISEGQTQSVARKIINGEVLYHRCAFTVWVFCGGEFYTLEDAAAEGLLTSEVLSAIADTHRAIECLLINN